MLAAIGASATPHLSPQLSSTAIYERVSAAPDGLDDFKLIVLTEQIAATFAQSVSALLDCRISQLFNPADAGYLIRQFSLVLDSERAVRFDIPPGNTASATASPTEVRVSPAGNNRVQVQYHWTLPEQHKQAELLNRIIQTAPSALALHQPVTDTDGKIIDFQLLKANQLAFEWLGVTADAAYAQPLSALVPGFRHSKVFRQFQRAALTGEPACFELDFGSVWYEFSVASYEQNIIVSVNEATRRKQTELALQKHTKSIERILDAIPLGIYVSEAVRDAGNHITDFYVTEANATALLTNQWQRSEVIGQLSSRLFLGDRFDTLFKWYNATLETGQTQRFDYAFQQDGQTRWLDVQLAYLDKDRVLTAYNDITPLRVAEAQRREQADTFTGVLRSMLNGLNVMEYIRDETGTLVDLRYQYVSDQVLIDTGLEQKQLINNQLRTLFPAIVDTPFWEAYQLVARTGEPQQFEMKYQGDGYNNHLLCQVTRLDENRAISTYQIINDLKQAQLAIQQQGDLLRLVVDNVQVGLSLMSAIRDEAGRIIDFTWLMTNEENARITGLSLTSMIGARMTDLLPATLLSGFLATCAAVVDTGVPFHSEIHYEDKTVNGWFDIRIVKQDDGILLSSSDITKRKQAELILERQNQTLQRANRDLQLSNENLQQFAYVASHDLQEPLRKIQAFGDLLAERFGPTLGPEGADMLTRMQTAAKRMSLLIRDLLTYSRITTQREPYQRVSLDQIMNEVLDTLSMPIQESQAQLTIASLPSLSGDSVQLSQLFQNLLGNAIKFCQPGQRPVVQISARILTARELPTSLLSKLSGKGPFIEITVADKGIGFESQYTERIFQVFQRLHGRRNYAGSGIGLSICRRVAENHGGTITASSKPNRGATFVVYLPA